MRAQPIYAVLCLIITLTAISTIPAGAATEAQAREIVDEYEHTIIDELDLGKGHEKFGCSNGVMENWIAEVLD